MATRKRISKRDFSTLTGLPADLYCRVSQTDSTGEKEIDEKSVDDQRREGRQWAEKAGVNVVRIFEDPGRSASRFATKDRPGFKALLEHVKSGEVAVVWVWAVDRSQRDLKVFAEMRDVFVEHQVALVVAGKLYDPNDYDGWMLLGITSFFGERYSEELSKNVRRGQQGAAMMGLPHGPVTFGYRRVYDKMTRRFERQEPDVWDGDGRPIEDSPAWVVREIYRRIKAGEGLVRIAQDLNDRRIPRPKAGATTAKNGWRNGDVKRIALNPAYIGRRVYQADWTRPGEAHKAILEGVQAQWPPLVDEETYWTVHRMLTDPARKQSRPAAAKSLLSCLVTCTNCGGYVVAGWTTQSGGRRYPVYSCMHRRCSSIRRAALDDYVEAVMIRWLSDPDNFAELTRVDDSAVASQARADAEQARSELAQWRQAAEDGEITLAGYKAAERGLLVRIEEAERRAQEATMPSALVGNIGEEAERKWNRASLEVKRQIIATVVDIRLRPTGMSNGHRWYAPSPEHRVEWHWLIGPDGGHTYAPQDPPPARPRLLTSEARALTQLANDGPLQFGELNRRVGMRGDSFERTARRMREKGWVTSERVARTGSRGSVAVYAITDAGREALAAHQPD